jgi:hypothetical protein
MSSPFTPAAEAPDGSGTLPRVGLDDLVWIVGSGRTGSTWLSQMLAAASGAALWFEPNFARAIGVTGLPENSYEQSPLFVLGGLPEHWIPPVRAFILAAVRARYPDHRRGHPLILKDQNNGEQIGRVLLAVPESRVLLLVRDPRDVMASIADTLRAPGSWAREWLTPDTPALDLNAFEACAHTTARNLGAALAAHDAHPGPRTIVTYEELRAAPGAALERICRELGIAASAEAIAASVARHDWSQIPEASKGSGRFHRKATPGGWREDLTADEVAAVERHAASLLERFYGVPAAPEPAPPGPEAPAISWPAPDVDPQLSATQALLDQLRATIATHEAAIASQKTTLAAREATIAAQQATIEELQRAQRRRGWFRR